VKPGVEIEGIWAVGEMGMPDGMAWRSEGLFSGILVVMVDSVGGSGAGTGVGLGSGELELELGMGWGSGWGSWMEVG